MLNGDAADEELLIEENIDSTDVFVALTNSEEANILSAMLAKRLGARKVMALINRPSYAELMESGSIDIAHLAADGHHRLAAGARAPRRRGARALAAPRRGRGDRGDRARHRGGTRVVGRRIEDIALPDGATIGAIVRGDEVIMAHHDTVIEADDHVILFLTDRRHVEQVERLFQAWHRAHGPAAVVPRPGLDADAVQRRLCCCRSATSLVYADGHASSTSSSPR